MLKVSPSDKLLYWLSAAKGDAEFSDEVVKQGCKTILKSVGDDFSSSKKSQLFEPLLRLGHVELVNERRYRLVPAVLLVLTDVEDNYNYLYGARVPMLLESIGALCGKSHSIFLQQEQGVSLYGLEKNIDISKLESLGIKEKKLSLLEVLRNLPSLSKVFEKYDDIGPRSFTSEWQFISPSINSGRVKSTWSQVNVKGISPRGLYRHGILPPHAAPWFLESEGRTCRIKSSEESYLAVWYLISSLDDVEIYYERNTQILAIPFVPNAFLPRILERLLLWHSGQMSHATDGYNKYKKITYAAAQEVARILELNLRVKA